jgi:tRNA-dihydrouridine synthase B
MGSDPDEMAAAAVKMVEQGRRSASIYRRLAAGEQPGPGERVTASERTFAAIDVNLACPVKKIKSKSRGGHWLRDPGGAIEILRAVRDATPAEVPCTLKIRRGSDDTPEAERNFYRIFDAAYELGYAWATVHGRTVEQKYVGPSRWTFLRDLVGARPDRPIFGSGDVWEAEDIFRMIAYTGVSAVSVARGCIGNPWIFRRARQLMAGAPPTMPTLGEQREALWSHYELSVAINGEERAGLMMRKFGIRFSALHPDPAAVKRAFIAAKSTADWRGVIEAHYPAGSASEPAAEAAGASGAV